MRSRHALASLVALSLCAAPSAAQARPFGTLREQAATQQRWLEQRMKTVLPKLMRAHGVDLWVVSMREYNEDPVFSSIVSPTTFAARRRTIYVFFDRCAAAGTADPGDGSCIERLALGGTSQGGVYKAYTAKQVIDNPAGGRNAELWGDQQWLLLKEVLEERNPKVIGIDVSRTHAFSDGLSAGELEGMRAMIGKKWTARFKRTEELPLQLIAARLPEEEQVFAKMNELVHSLIARMFSNEVITPGVTRTDDLVWWWRQQVNDLGLGTWFQPSVSIQRQGATAATLGATPVILAGDVLHCDVGITAMR
ncbi:MAG TPA: Xaa-Pro aminopeptidase, partial [Gemmatimonadaceae bacterium]|nr:Xaa-Pro aminopeptidase [Gemmatimonadaceae bacterium]